MFQKSVAKLEIESDKKKVAEETFRLNIQFFLTAPNYVHNYFEIFKIL